MESVELLGETSLRPPLLFSSGCCSPQPLSASLVLGTQKTLVIFTHLTSLSALASAKQQARPGSASMALLDAATALVCTIPVRVDVSA